MRPSAKTTSKRFSIRFALLATALAALLIPAGAGATASKTVVKTAQNSTLGKTVLTTTAGRTLYSLSAEHQNFVCVGTCLSTWHPLVVPAGTKPKGPVALGTLKRPNGPTQVTYKGLPLYTFGGDTKKGEANGEGIKDVGTWHAASTAKASSQPQPSPSPEPPNYPY